MGIETRLMKNFIELQIEVAQLRSQVDRLVEIAEETKPNIKAIISENNRTIRDDLLRKFKRKHPESDVGEPQIFIPDSEHSLRKA